MPPGMLLDKAGAKVLYDSISVNAPVSSRDGCVGIKTSYLRKRRESWP